MNDHQYHDLLGLGFRYGARDPKEGALDCYGVVVEMARRNGQILPTRSVSEDHALIHALMASQMNVWRRVDQPQAGCVVLLKVKHLPCHVGYLINEFDFIHAWKSSGGPVVEALSAWERRIEGFYEYVG